ncbi:MAG: flagellar biosynthesis protein FlhF, partial [Pseudomonadota bacterium]
MKIKRYLDKDMRNVLRRVREDQGPDAVILSNRRIDEGIEVIAAIDYDEALVRHAMGAAADDKAAINGDSLARIAEDDLPAAADATVLSANLTQTETETPPAATFDDIAKVESLPVQPDVTADVGEQHLLIDGVREEMASMRGMIASQLSSFAWQATSERDPMRAQILRNFARLGLSPDTAQMLLDRLGPIEDVRRLWQEPLMELARSIPVTQNTLLEEGGTYALLGPTGVGKTTTIAKMAARFAMRHGADQIALVSADAYRIGAREHLTAFSNIIGAKVYSASSSDELSDVLMRLGRYRLVLIDTEGRSQRDRELANRLAAWGDHKSRVRYYL